MRRHRVDEAHSAGDEQFFIEILRRRETELGPSHAKTATAAENLAAFYVRQGRFDKAEPVARRAVEIWAQTRDAAVSGQARSLQNLAAVYEGLGAYGEAKSLVERALKIRGAAQLPTQHRDMASSHESLGRLALATGDFGTAEAGFRKAFAIYNRPLQGSAHNKDSVRAALLLGAMLKALGKRNEFDALHRDLFNNPQPYTFIQYLLETPIVDIGQGWKRRDPFGDPIFADAIAVFVDTRMERNELKGLTPLLARALAIAQTAFGSTHPQYALILHLQGRLAALQGQGHEALRLSTLAVQILRDWPGRESQPIDTASVIWWEHPEQRILYSHLDLLASMPSDQSIDGLSVTGASFDTGQLVSRTRAAQAVALMSARFSAGTTALASDVREQQDAIDRLKWLTSRLLEILATEPNRQGSSAAAPLRVELKALEEKIRELDEAIVRDFPDYAALIEQRPLPLAEAQQLLQSDEALIGYVVGDRGTYQWVLRHDQAAFRRLSIGRQQLDELVAKLRVALDLKGLTRPGQIPSFDTKLSFRLYNILFAPAEPLLEGVQNVFLVLDAGLQSLPLGVLVTDEPKGDLTDLPGFRNVPWLARKYAMTVLPAVSSLRALRGSARPSSASRPFIGFGDLAVGGTAGTRRLAASALFSGGAGADVDVIRALAPLPGTAVELYAIAETLGAKLNESVFLRQDATEARLRDMDISGFRVVAFATHGLVAGQFKGLGEPGLVLTPPSDDSEADDGFLAASEIAPLKLDADWVILSACNTAAPDGTPGAEGLSGLAKAFFYAGSRALLVSHWEVDSGAAVQLTTAMLKATQDRPKIGRAEALRRSMLELMDDEANPHYAHPAFWAPFVVVGEGGSVRY